MAMSHNDSLHILEKAHSIIKIERLLTETLEQVKPWLPQAANAQNVNHNRLRVRPIPRNMDEAYMILSVARNLAARTSAPAGWNPNAPVVGFSTPSPLPHQLRGGALATLQLERARQVEREKKRQRIQMQQHEQQQKQKEKEKQKPRNEASGSSEIATDTISDTNRQQIDQARMEAAQRNVHFQQQQRLKPKQDVSMNLSDDDSDSDDDDENEDSED